MRRLRAALLPAVLGLLVHVASYSAAWTARMLLSPGLEVSSASAWLRGSLMVFAEGVFWTLLVDAPLALPVTLLLGFLPPRHAGAAAVATGVLAFIAASWIKPSAGTLDVALLAGSVWLGARTSLRLLQRGRTRALPSNFVPRLP